MIKKNNDKDDDIHITVQINHCWILCIGPCFEKKNSWIHLVNKFLLFDFTLNQTLVRNSIPLWNIFVRQKSYSEHRNSHRNIIWTDNKNSRESDDANVTIQIKYNLTFFFY